MARKFVFGIIILCLALVFVFADENANQQTQTKPNELKVDKTHQTVERIDFTDCYIDSEYHLIAADYLVNHSIFIGYSGALFIEPGTRLFFAANCGIICEGSIYALGTSERPIEFKAVGNARWGGVIIVGSEYDDTKIEYCNFEQSSCMKIAKLQRRSYLNDEKSEEINIGGALTILKSNISVSNCNFQKCHSAQGSAVFVYDSKVWLSECKFTDNLADSGSVYIADSECMLEKCDFVDNVSTGNAAGVLCEDTYQSIVNENYNPSVTFEKCNFINNKAAYHGAAITAFHEVKVTVNESIFKNNSGGKERCFGGAILSYESILEVRYCKFIENSASLGGAILVGVHDNPADWMELSVYNCIFEKNKAAKGGAISISKIPTTIEDSKFIENEAKMNGGAIIFWEFNECDIYKCDFLRNKAELGGAISCEYSSFNESTISETEFIGNVAFAKGGALLIGSKQDDIVTEYCKFKDNKPNDIEYDEDEEENDEEEDDDENSAEDE